MLGRRFFGIILIFFIDIFTLGSYTIAYCENLLNINALGKEVRLVVTNSIIFDICKTLLSKNANIHFLNGEGSCCHDYEPKILDLIKISDSDFFLHFGDSIDTFLVKVFVFLENRNNKCKIIELSSFSFKNKEDKNRCDCREVDIFSSRQENNVCKKHFWGNIEDIISASRVIYDLLIKHPLVDKQILGENYKFLEKRLYQFRKRIYSSKNRIKNTKFLVLGHTTLKPFFNDLGLKASFIELDADDDGVSFSDTLKVLKILDDKDAVLITEDEKVIKIIKKVLRSEVAIGYLKPMEKRDLLSLNFLDILEYNLSTIVELIK